MLLNEVLNQLDDAWIVGGAVRDFYLGLPIKDVDIVTASLPDEVEKMFPDSYPLGKKFGTIVVPTSDWGDVEITTMREDVGRGRHPEVKFTKSLTLDLTRRDFTMNSMCMKSFDDEIYDPQEGRFMLNSGMMETVGRANDRLAEDPLRALRAVRFSLKYNLRFDKHLHNAMFKTNLSEVSGERIFEELLQILSIEAEAGMSMLKHYGLLRQFLIEIDIMDFFDQNPEYHPEGNVWLHTLMAIAYAFANGFSPFEIFCTLLHDIGKPISYDGEHYYGHAGDGARLVTRIARRFGLSGEQSKCLEFVIDNHMKACEWDNLRTSKKIRIATSPYFETLCKVHAADCSMRPRDCMADKMRDYHVIIKPKIQPLLTGNDLLKRNYKPGPIFSELLNRVVELQVEGIINTREQALDWLDDI